jgi:hypothetical protein
MTCTPRITISRRRLLGGDYSDTDVSWEAIAAHTASLASWLVKLRRKPAAAAEVAAEHHKQRSAPSRRRTAT